MENKKCSCGPQDKCCSCETQTFNSNLLLKWNSEEDFKVIYLVTMGNTLRPPSPEDVDAVEKAFKASLSKSNEVGFVLPSSCALQVLKVSPISRTIFMLGSDQQPVTDDEIKDFQERFARAVETDGVLVTRLQVRTDRFYVENGKCQKS